MPKKITHVADSEPNHYVCAYCSREIGPLCGHGFDCPKKAGGLAKPNFTPGPWRVETWHYSNSTPTRDVLTVQTDKDAIAQICELWCPDTRAEEAKANAALIASAPDMHAALKTTAQLLTEILDLLSYYHKGEAPGHLDACENPEICQHCITVRKIKAHLEPSNRGPRCADCNQLLEDTFHTGVFFHVSPCRLDLEPKPTQPDPAAPPTVEEWGQIADALTVYGFPTAQLEGGGAAATFIGIELDDEDGRYMAFGCNADNWTGDIYESRKAFEEGNNPEDIIETDAPTRNTDGTGRNHDPETIADALYRAMCQAFPNF